MITLAVALCNRSEAMSVEQLSLRELITEADMIFDGFLENEVSGRLANGSIVTHLQFTSVEWLKGEGSTTFVMQLIGGTIGDETVFIPGGPVIQTGARYVMMVEKHLHTVFPIAGGWQGVFQMVPQTSGPDAIVDGGGRLIVQNSYGGILTERYFVDPPEPGREMNITPVRGRLVDETHFCDIIWRVAASQVDTSPENLTFGTFVPFTE